MARRTPTAQPLPSPRAQPIQRRLTMLVGDRAIEQGASGQTAPAESAYAWDMRTGLLSWDKDAADVLQVSPNRIASADEYHALIAPEHVARRRRLTERLEGTPCGQGLPYQLGYRVNPWGPRTRASLWIEDVGRCWSDANGVPTHARGVIRAVPPDVLEIGPNGHAHGDADELTGHLNRMRLTDALAAVITRAERTGSTAALLMASIDNLSTLNDLFGPDAGDEVIVGVTRIIRDTLRGGDSLGRYASNKFGVVLNGCDAGDMRISALRLIETVRRTTFQTSACTLSATISVGGVLLPVDARSPARAAGKALQALDRARLGADEGFAAFEPGMAKESRRRQYAAIADEIVQASNEHRIALARQPIVDARTRKVVLHEALLRIERPDGTLLGAGAFAEIAEKVGLHRLLDQRAIGLACQALANDPALTLSVNLSSLTCGDPDWLNSLRGACAERSDLASRLVIEITETAAMGDLARACAFIEEVRRIGCRVAIDDFGAGYTSFKCLKSLPVDIVKIDGAFVRNVVGSVSDRIFLKAVVDVAADLGLDTVAEWVGDEATARHCAEAGISMLQGYFFGQPMLMARTERAPG